MSSSSQDRYEAPYVRTGLAWLLQCKDGDLSEAMGLYEIVTRHVDATKIGTTLDEVTTIARIANTTFCADTLAILRSGEWDKWKANGLWNITHWPDPKVGIRPEDIGTTEEELERLTRRPWLN